ncbi:oocyte zinc finger protein XlCOF22-like isoform X1 [Xenopus laevis]|uniref:Oocyte zinc finger protein XlCOF22-like isoform X1 n=2 Tax=Xenopus laevis TaxID=8355 RepID=A0A8J0VM77_XENLA|nr:oocyte zinc finger protein XlCOF22-like isoform X1 [Xenopus laevis]
MGISQEPTEPVMGNQDPDQLHETILTLTLEIIYLLTGEGYTVTKKSGDDMPLPQSCTDCMLGGACRHHVTSPTVAPPPGSVIQKENAKKILELMSNIIQLLTGEVAIRCEDVSLYFSLEEWQYLKGNKSRYREVIEENWKQLRSLGGEYGGGRDSEWDLGADVCDANKPDKTEAEEADSWGEGNPPNTDISANDPQTPTNCISHGIKAEPTSWEEGEDSDSSRSPPKKQIQGAVPPTEIMGSTVEATVRLGNGYGEPLLWGLEEHSVSNIKPLKKRIKRTILPIMPSSSNQSSPGKYVSAAIKDKPVSREDDDDDDDEGSDCSIVFPIEQRQVEKPSADMGCGLNDSLSGNSISDAINEEPSSWDEDSSVEQEQGKLQPTDIMGFSLKLRAPAYHSITMEAATRGKGTPPNTDISVANQHSPNCLSNGNNEEAAAWEIGEPSDFIANTHREEPPADTMGTSLTDRLPGGNCTEYNKVIESASPMQAEVQSFTCYECGKCFVSQRDLFKHLRIHTGKKTFLCCECGMCFVHQIDLHRHMKSHTGDRPFSCSVCGKRFRSQSDCNRHLIIHTGEKPFACSECGRCFGFLSSLRRHFSLHMRKEQFSCGHCGECFVLQSHLNNHLRIHSIKKSCPECGKCFAREIDLNRHSTTHTGQKMFSCSECGKDFGFESDLHRHLRTHKEKKAFSCPECGRGFECESDLSRHLRIHEEKKPLSCSHCGKYFLCQSELKRHFRIHTGEKPFSCSKCGRCFGFLSSLRRHCRTHFKKAVN